MKQYRWGQTITGLNASDTIYATWDTADAIFQGPGEFVWDRKVDANGGNDTIIRDRVGDFKADAKYYAMDNTGYVSAYFPDGDVTIYGGGGEDTLDYSLWNGGIAAKLTDFQNMNIEGEYGWVSNYTLTADAVFGHDNIWSIENIIATDHMDVLEGNARDNKFWGLAGNDILQGFAGDDGLYGGNGFDMLEGGTGNDTMDGGAHADTMHGGDGDDLMWGGTGSDLMFGDDGNDQMFGDHGFDNMWGGNGEDNMHGGTHDDFMSGDAGDDTMYGDHGDDEMLGGTGEDTLYGGAGDDDMNGGHGDDYMNGGSGQDELHGGHDDDVVIGGNHNDWVWGDEGSDMLFGGNGNDWLYVDAEDNVANGGSGNDRIWVQDGTGLGFNISIDGSNAGTMTRSDGMNSVNIEDVEEFVLGGGNDFVDIDAGVANEVWAGDGWDMVFLSGHADYVNGGAGDDLIKTGWGNDTADGGSGNDTIDGQGAHDTIDGGAGSDNIRGGHGNDLLIGGLDADTFIWKSGDTGIDTITDFVIGEDLIDVDDFIMSPVVGGNYAPQVKAFFTLIPETILLVAKTSADEWTPFAYLEGHNLQDVGDAILSGALFGTEVVPSGVAFPGTGDILWDIDTAGAQAREDLTTTNSSKYTPEFYFRNSVRSTGDDEVLPIATNDISDPGAEERYYETVFEVETYAANLLEPYDLII